MTSIIHDYDWIVFSMVDWIEISFWLESNPFTLVLVASSIYGSIPQIPLCSSTTIRNWSHNLLPIILIKVTKKCWNKIHYCVMYTRGVFREEFLGFKPLPFLRIFINLLGFFKKNLQKLDTPLIYTMGVVMEWSLGAIPPLPWDQNWIQIFNFKIEKLIFLQ